MGMPYLKKKNQLKYMFAIEGWRKNLFIHTGYCNFHHLHNKLGHKTHRIIHVRAREAEDNKPEAHNSKDKYKYRSSHSLLQKYKRKYA